MTLITNLVYCFQSDFRLLYNIKDNYLFTNWMELADYKAYILNYMVVELRFSKRMFPQKATVPDSQNDSQNCPSLHRRCAYFHHILNQFMLHSSLEGDGAVTKDVKRLAAWAVSGFCSGKVCIFAGTCTIRVGLYSVFWSGYTSHGTDYLTSLVCCLQPCIVRIALLDDRKASCSCAHAITTVTMIRTIHKHYTNSINSW